ncbi:hypothetical protein DM02DRAFT_615084 [Periconia macrospinosa]|uniref:Elongator complex protein 5 n=1 Tax=Periconia macrospinosa TaxID=97972 RepID=A0A2V1DPZ2_9PLEO|nr:hypothetical protein DM02DRAFT_615084 [Periconia macrospinosa]
MTVPNTSGAHQRHAIQLISRVLSVRAGASPFTLILDSLTQRATSVLREILRRVMGRRARVIMVSFESKSPFVSTLGQGEDGIRWVDAWAGKPENLFNILETALREEKTASTSSRTNPSTTSPSTPYSPEIVVVVDNIHDLLTHTSIPLPQLFTLVAGQYAASLIGIYHTDLIDTATVPSAYAPAPLLLLNFTATTILTLRSYTHVLATARAQSQSLPEPVYSLPYDGTEGILEDLSANSPEGGVVLDAEFRRKSGRAERYTYFLRPPGPSDYAPLTDTAPPALRKEFIVLLEQVPSYAIISNPASAAVDKNKDGMETSFNLGLTDKQREKRENVVLPYFDAQKGEGAGEGGRILYDMGEEDDFDEEEDEI